MEFIIRGKHGLCVDVTSSWVSKLVSQPQWNISICNLLTLTLMLLCKTSMKIIVCIIVKPRLRNHYSIGFRIVGANLNKITLKVTRIYWGDISQERIGLPWRIAIKSTITMIQRMTWIRFELVDLPTTCLKSLWSKGLLRSLLESKWN